MKEVGRSPEGFGIEGRVKIAEKRPEEWVETSRAWEALGATYIALETRWAGLTSATDHILAMRRFKEMLDA